MAGLGTTYGHVKANVFAARPYYKPSLRKLVIRFPGVTRKSEKVIKVNEQFARIKPASACKGKSFSDGSFQRCLREQLKGKLGA